MNPPLNPAITVAAIVERGGSFLFVEEQTAAGLALNQPAGHLESHESLEQALVRETLEETAWHVEPEALVGVYLWRHPQREVTVVRFAYVARCRGRAADATLDAGIERVLWLQRRELAESRYRLRSPLVTRCLDDYLAGRRFPLACVNASGLRPPAVPQRAGPGR